MTKTYHDIEAVTRLLQEKEKDLELAAKIGQELLERNKTIDERVASLENQLTAQNELITQLRHELQVRRPVDLCATCTTYFRKSVELVLCCKI